MADATPPGIPPGFCSVFVIPDYKHVPEHHPGREFHWFLADPIRKCETGCGIVVKRHWKCEECGHVLCNVPGCFKYKRSPGSFCADHCIQCAHEGCELWAERTKNPCSKASYRCLEHAPELRVQLKSAGPPKFKRAEHTYNHRRNLDKNQTVLKKDIEKQLRRITKRNWDGNRNSKRVNRQLVRRFGGNGSQIAAVIRSHFATGMTLANMGTDWTIRSIENPKLFFLDEEMGVYTCYNVDKLRPVWIPGHQPVLNL